MQHSSQITTVTIIDFQGFYNKWFAFSAMGIIPFLLKGEGMHKGMLMGSGADNGFGAKPNFGRYAFVAIWDNDESSQVFFKQNKIWNYYIGHASQFNTHRLQNTMSHGAWGGHNPFQKGGDHDENAKVAVITRATIKWRHMWRFWQNVPDSSKGIKDKEGLVFAIGIGEWPLRFQATFSIWENAHFMKKFAYESKQHTDMIKKTKHIGWYKEELFARFKIFETV